MAASCSSCSASSGRDALMYCVAASVYIYVALSLRSGNFKMGGLTRLADALRMMEIMSDVDALPSFLSAASTSDQMDYNGHSDPF